MIWSSEPGFFAALPAAFDRVPELFAATAQIFFPDGQRREETGKAMYDPEAIDACAAAVRRTAGGRGPDVGALRVGRVHALRYGEAAGAGRVQRGDDAGGYVEDLDVGYRGWLRGWPSVYVGAARVLHLHRTTTAKVYSAFALACAVERNYLRFVLTGTGPHFGVLWEQALSQLNHQAAKQEPVRSAEVVLAEAWKLAFAKRSQQATEVEEKEILALNAGTVAVFPGKRFCETKPTVLVATPYLPDPLSHGGAVRMFNLLREASKTHNNVVLSFVDELATPAPELLAWCAEVVLVERRGSHLHTSTERPDVVEDFDREDFPAALRWSRRKWKPEIVQLEFTQMALYAPDCRRRGRYWWSTTSRSIYTSSCLSRRATGRRGGSAWLWVRFEQKAWGEVDRVVVMSEDRERVGRPGAVVIRNGVDLERFQPVEGALEPRRLLFLGSFAHLPNLLALDFLAEVWPRLENVTLHIIAGKNHKRIWRAATSTARHRALEGFVADVRGAYGRAAVVLAPLVASAGTNIKVMEAMAMRKAIVATPAGINGLDLRHGVEVLVARTGGEMAVAIEMLLGDGERRESLEREARRAAEAHYGWDRIGEAQAAMYHTLRDLCRKNCLISAWLAWR
jgi:glycosyltransferase involved in cell wall biosynthesis